MSGYGTPYGILPAGPTRQWPTKEPDDFRYRTYNATLDLTNPVTGVVDVIISAALKIRPSGTGDIVASLLSVDAARRTVTVWLGLGVPGRTYLVNLEVGTQGGQILQFPIGIQCDPLFATYPLPPVTAPDFGPIITWAGALAMTDSAGNVVMDSGGNLIFQGNAVELDSDGYPVRDSNGNFVFSS